MADLLASPPLGQHLPTGRFGAPGPAGVILNSLPLSACILVAGRDKAALRAAIASHFGIEPEDAPKYQATDTASFIGTGPSRWLVLSVQDNLFARLEQAAGAAGSVFEQSGGLVVLEAAGPELPRTLAKLIPLDLDPAIFPIGAAATTNAAHINLTLWKTEEGCFAFAVGRSFFAAFLRAFACAAAEFGLDWRG
ncbi:sarcosine oxidase subunit gamma [Rhodoblastus sp.]|uniref:sarcosine oxidase subunit gamma n=1 Tax=Rhodoblastus sp. TaxID=1962975 RepID=UPI0035AF9871